MNTFIEDFKFAWNKPNNGLIRLIIINVAVFLFINTIIVVSKWTRSPELYAITGDILILPSYILSFLYRPWTLITYFFTHEGFWHILQNMLVMYWFGFILSDLLGNRRLLALYFLGGIAGGVAYLIMANLGGYFGANSGTGLLGASACVNAIVVGTATHSPEYRLNLLFIGPVKIKYIAAVIVLLSFFGTAGNNVGGNVAHLGGALIGYIYIKQLMLGNDIGRPIMQVGDWIANLFKRKPKLKVTYSNRRRGASGSSQSYTAAGGSPSSEPNQRVVDAILDKISESGYEGLTKEEKQILFKASQKK